MFFKRISSSGFSPRLARLAILSLTDLLIFPAPGPTADKVQHIVDFAIRGVLADASRADELAASP